MLAASVKAKLPGDATRAHGVYAVADHGKSDEKCNYPVNSCDRPSRKMSERTRRGRAGPGESARMALLLYWCEHHRSPFHLSEIPNHQDNLVGHPKVDRGRPVVQADGQLSEDVVA